MKKNKELIIDIIIFLLILISIIPVILTNKLGNLDEIWNYNFANNIANNLIPYKDFNMIQMPLLPIICSIFLKIFGNQLIVMRILAIILSTSILFTLYKIFKILKINKILMYISLLCIFNALNNYLCIDYNFALLLVTLIIIYIEIKEYLKNEKILKYNFKIDFLLGILAGICIILKQSTGLLITFGLVGYKIFEIRNKNNIKEFMSIGLTRVLGISIPIFMLLTYLIINNALNYFIDYCILGIRTFSNYIAYLNLLKSNNKIIKILSILIPITLVIMPFIGTFKNKKILLIIFIYSMTEFVVAFPISDEIHFLIGAIPCTIGIIYIINLLISKINIKNGKIRLFTKEFIKCMVYIILSIKIINSIYETYIYIEEANYYNNIKHFSYIPVSDSLTDTIQNIDNFILKQNKKVYILDAEAAIYMIPIDRYNKNYDMFLKGNLGSGGEEKQIENLKQDNNIVLIKNDKYSRNWQNPELVRKYIRDNMRKLGEIGYFDIYIGVEKK